MCSPEQLTKRCPDEKSSLMFSEQCKLWVVIIFPRKRREPCATHCFTTFEAGMPRGTHQIYVTQCRSEPSIKKMDILISYRLIRENLHLQLWGVSFIRPPLPLSWLSMLKHSRLGHTPLTKMAIITLGQPKAARPRLQWEEMDISVKLAFSFPAMKTDKRLTKKQILRDFSSFTWLYIYLKKQQQKKKLKF